MKKILFALIVIILAVGLGIYLYLQGQRDETDAVDSGDAGSLVEGSDADIDPGMRPEGGTYTFTGSGRESVSTLGGSEHVFPDEIPVVVVLDPEDDCQFTLNVLYVEQHVEERRFCTDDEGLHDRGFTRETEFFGQTQLTEYDCPPDEALRRRNDAEVGDTWEWTCTTPTSEGVYAAELLEVTELEIDGESVPVHHVAITTTLTGGTRGTDRSEWWFAESGLPVRFSTNLDVDTDSVLGETRFQEQTSYELTSLQPRESSDDEIDPSDEDEGDEG